MEDVKRVDWGWGASFGNIDVVFDMIPGWEMIDFEDGSSIQIRPHGIVCAYGNLYSEYKSALSMDVRPKEACVREFLVDGERWV